MAKYAARRLLSAIPTLLVTTILVFLMLRVVPGDVAVMILGGESGSASRPFTLEKLREELGLNRPLHEQYFTWLFDIIRGNLGESLFTGRSVAGELARRVPITVQLVLMAAVLSVVLGIPLGILSAVKQDTWIDYVARSVSFSFLGMPSFWIGLMVLLVGLEVFNWMPPTGYHPLWGDFGPNMAQLSLPALVLTSHQMARVARMTRSTLLEVLRTDYIRTARAKGLTENIVIMRHALKNALIPVVTMMFIYIGVLFAGTVVMEHVFSIPGLGSLFIDSLSFRDYTIIQVLIPFMGAVFIILNLIADLLYGWLDPRISHS